MDCLQRSSWDARWCARYVAYALFWLMLLLLAGPFSAAQTRAPGDGRVGVFGHLSSDVTPRNHDVRFWISIENRSDQPLLNLHLDRLERDGFAKDRWCWGAKTPSGCGVTQRPGPSCLAPGATNTSATGEFDLCDYLRPHEVLTVWGDLTAKGDLPPHELMALVSWKQPVPPPPCRLKDASKCPPAPAAEAAKASLIVNLGRAEPIAAWRYFFRRYTPKSDISIPGALTLLGLFFTWWAGRRQEKNQIWTTMLGKVHEFAMHYYMPMASMVDAAARRSETYRNGLSEAGKNKTPASPATLAAGRRGFYYLMMFHWWRRETFLKVGAYHLRNRPGEDLLFVLAADHDKSFLQESESAVRQLERVKSVLEQDTTLDDFLETLDSGSDPDITALWTVYERWIGSATGETDLAVLEAFAAVMDYEVNQISKDWYAGRERIAMQGRVGELLREKGTETWQSKRYLRVARWGRIPVYDRVCDWVF